MNDEQFERFMAKVEITPTCWIWTGASRKTGYGGFRLDGRRSGPRKVSRVHRVSYEHFVGPIPDGLVIDHLCRNTECVNPEHLEAVTRRENSIRGIGWAGRNARKTSCTNGHEFTPENTRVYRGGRICRECHTNDNRARYRRHDNSPPSSGPGREAA